jgi:ABC-type branched-subunit amino acid transport system ATPase component
MNPIETDKLTRRFGRTVALSDVTLAVPEGSICAVLGPNGAGKTTLLETLLNLLEPSAGSAQVLGCDSRRLGPAQFAQIGYVSENQRVDDRLRIGELLDVVRDLYPTWDRTLEAKLLRTFELPVDRRFKALSRGMRIRALFVVALAFRPKLLVLDEPFSGLDPVDARRSGDNGDRPRAGGWQHGAALVARHRRGGADRQPRGFSGPRPGDLGRGDGGAEGASPEGGGAVGDGRSGGESARGVARL